MFDIVSKSMNSSLDSFGNGNSNYNLTWKMIKIAVTFHIKVVKEYVS
jgi:hypothetical protein